jgi:hypothetical protein
MARHYIKSWSRTLTIEPWMAPDTVLLQHESARFLGISPLTLRRLARGASGPPFNDDFAGRGSRYRVKDLIHWRHALTGLGPGPAEIWDWWLENGYLIEGRGTPRARGDRPRGQRERHFRQQRRQRLRGLVLRAEMLCALDRIDRPEITDEWIGAVREK